MKKMCPAFRTFGTATQLVQQAVVYSSLRFREEIRVEDADFGIKGLQKPVGVSYMQGCLQS